MKKNEISYIIFLGSAVAVLAFTLGQYSVLNDLTQSDHAVNINTAEVLTADGFEKSPLYSMYWIREKSWIDQGILLVIAERPHKKYGYAPCFAKAQTEIKKKYTITTRIPLVLFPAVHDASTNGLLLEVEPKQVEPKQ